MMGTVTGTRRVRSYYRNPMQFVRAIALIGTAAVALLLGHAVADTSKKELTTIADIYTAIRVCWKAPKVSVPTELVVRLSFTRKGNILGKAQVTHENRIVSNESMLLFRKAVIETFQRCTPLPFSRALGDAIAGRPMNFYFRQNSGLRI